MDSLEFIAEKLNKCQNIAVFVHVRPDGDTIGSAIGFKLGMESLGKKVDVYSSDAVPEKFYFIEQVKEIKCEYADNKYDAYVALDCSEDYRIGDLVTKFLNGKETFSIDHHVSNTRFAKYNYVEDRASNSENVYNLLKIMKISLTKEMATPLLMGMITDTGNFSQKNTDSEVLSSASELVRIGADINNLNYLMFKKQSKERAKLFGRCMNKIRFFYEDKIAIISVLKEDLELSGATPDMTEGFIDFALNIDKTEVAICLLEVKNRQYKISFRSKGANVNEIAGVFGGGGHVLASGCMLNGYYEDVIDKLVYACKQRIPT